MTTTTIGATTVPPSGEALLDAIAAAVGTTVDVPDPRAAAREAYTAQCASCHGDTGRGVKGRGPTLANAGPAEALFYLTTGRMPLDEQVPQAERKPVVLSSQVIALLAWYVSMLSDAGTPLVTVDPAAGSLADGQRLYLANCAACHQAAGAGGALFQHRYAPSLFDATPRQVAEAIRIGPGSMPKFGPHVLDDREVNDIARYVEYLKNGLPARGGLALGRIGPIIEGFVAFIIGLGVLLAITRWIGTRE
jgi:ubiquinol-cytochrome c reductase cytochrome c subunit